MRPRLRLQCVVCNDDTKADPGDTEQQERNLE